jgi:hypothetical protein
MVSSFVSSQNMIEFRTKDQGATILRSQFVTSRLKFSHALTPTLSRMRERGKIPSPRLRGEGQGEGQAVTLVFDRN